MKSEGLLGERDRLLGVRQVAEHLGLSQVTVYRWCREGILPCLKIGGSLRVRQSALEDFLERSERSATLGGQLRSFLRVPDNVLGIAQTPELLLRLDAAFLRVGEARGGKLVKFHGSHTGASVDELRVLLEEGLDVEQLEDEGRFGFVQESDPPNDRMESLRKILSEEAEKGRTLWVIFDWMKDVDLDKTLEQQEKLTRFVGERQLVVITLLPEQAAEDWPPLIQRHAQTLHTSTVWISEAGLLTCRMSPLQEEEN